MYIINEHTITYIILYSVYIISFILYIKYIYILYCILYIIYCILYIIYYILYIVYYIFYISYIIYYILYNIYIYDHGSHKNPMAFPQCSNRFFAPMGSQLWVVTFALLKSDLGFSARYMGPVFKKPMNL